MYEESTRKILYTIANTHTNAHTHRQTGGIQWDIWQVVFGPIIHNLFIETTHDKGWVGRRHHHGRRSGAGNERSSVLSSCSPSPPQHKSSAGEIISKTAGIDGARRWHARGRWRCEERNTSFIFFSPIFSNPLKCPSRFFLYIFKFSHSIIKPNRVSCFNVIIIIIIHLRLTKCLIILLPNTINPFVVLTVYY